jgi:hypothetical protein
MSRTFGAPGALATAEPTADPSNGGGGGDTSTGGSAVDLGNGIGFEVPSGFDVVAAEQGFAQLFGEGGYFFAYVTPTPADLTTMINNHLLGLQSDDGLAIQELQISDPQPVEIPTSAVVTALRLDYAGVMASQQGGTLPVEGFAYYFLLQDGTGVTAFGLWEQGAVTSDSDPLVVAYNQMLSSLVSSF